MAARKYAPPASWVAEGGEWPEGPLREDAPPYAVVTAEVVRAYRRAAGSQSLRSVASAAGIDATSLGRTLAGETVPDVHTVAVLEDALGVALWPDYPRATPRTTP
jgi:DNA-binding phage protein